MIYFLISIDFCKLSFCTFPPNGPKYCLSSYFTKKEERVQQGGVVSGADKWREGERGCNDEICPITRGHIKHILSTV